jgi:hypothetical protein
MPSLRAHDEWVQKVSGGRETETTFRQNREYRIRLEERIEKAKVGVTV